MNKLSASVIPEEERRLYPRADPETETRIKEVEQFMRDAMEKTYCGRCDDQTPVIPNPGKPQMEKVLCRCGKIYMSPAEKITTEKRRKLSAAALLAGAFTVIIIALITVLVKYA